MSSIIKADLTYRFENFPAHTPLSEARIRELVKGALYRWSQFTVFTFTPAASDTADITFKFGDPGASSDGDTVARYFPSEKMIVYNNAMTWIDQVSAYLVRTKVSYASLAIPFWSVGNAIWELVEADRSGADITVVTLHEVGHWLGLAHSNTPDQTVRQYRLVTPEQTGH